MGFSLTQLFAKGFNNDCAAVDGKHPDGSNGGHFFVLFNGGTHTGPEDLHAPSGKAAHKKFFQHKNIVAKK